MDLEGLLVLAVYGLLLVPALQLARRSPAPWVRLAVLLLWAAGLAGVGRAMISYRMQLTLKTIEPSFRPIQDPTQGYLTSHACRSCHPGEYASWHGSYHRTMTQLVSPESVKGSFDDQVVVAKGRTYRLFRKGEEFWVEMDLMMGEVPAGKPLPRVEQRLLMITGSHHMQVYWFSSGLTRRLEQLPIVWLIDEGRWIPRTAAFIMPPHDFTSTESGRWNFTCIKCHATHGRPLAENTHEMDTRVSEFGIACESCHGPAEDHVRLHSNPLARYRRHVGDSPGDDSIVHPARLDPVRASQTCGQCHSLFHDDEETVLAWVKSGPAYRPGDDLDQTQQTITVRKPDHLARVNTEDPEAFVQGFWPDGVVRVSGREYNALIDSPCYVNGHGGRKMSCLSCHQMHGPAHEPASLKGWADDQLKPGMRGDQACLQCHGDFAGRIEAHTHHAAASAGSRCYNCHMPPNTYGLLKAIHNHRIDSPSVASSLQTGRPNACNQCHLDQTLEWSAQHLRDWFGQPVPEMGADERRIAASLLWQIKGDAAQRALMAWNMSWPPAREASGTDWMAPFLAQMMADPYDAVRYIAGRSVRSLPGFEGFAYDFEATDEQRKGVAAEIYAVWQRRHRESAGRVDPALLITAPGEMDVETARRMHREQNTRPVLISE
jgi:hypothetical protein